MRQVLVGPPRFTENILHELDKLMVANPMIDGTMRQDALFRGTYEKTGARGKPCRTMRGDVKEEGMHRTSIRCSLAIMAPWLCQRSASSSPHTIAHKSSGGASIILRSRQCGSSWKSSS